MTKNFRFPLNAFLLCETKTIVFGNLQQEAHDHLQAIRGLMERATLYRAISGPAALFGGGLAILVSAAFYRFSGSVGEGSGIFLMAWIGVLLAASLINLVLLCRRPERPGEGFWSRGMRAAIQALWPSLVGTGFLGVMIALGENGSARLPIVAVLWMLGYGVALLATAGFAPFSLRLLGFAFILASLGSGIAILHGSWLSTFQPAVAASVLMGASFGLFHLIYGAVVVLWQGSREQQTQTVS